MVFPTPPFPATMTTREVEQNSATSIAPSYEARATTRQVRWRRLLMVLGGGALIASSFGAVAGAQNVSRGRIDVVQVNGLIDPSNAALIHNSLQDAVHSHSSVVIFQMAASGSVDVDVNALVADFENSRFR